MNKKQKQIKEELETASDYLSIYDDAFILYKEDGTIRALHPMQVEIEVDHHGKPTGNVINHWGGGGEMDGHTYIVKKNITHFSINSKEA